MILPLYFLFFYYSPLRDMNRYLLFGGLLCREGIGQCREAVAQRSLDWLAVLEAVLECLMRIVYDVAGRVVIRIVEAEGLRIKSTSSNSSRLHENEIHTEFLFMRI